MYVKEKMLVRVGDTFENFKICIYYRMKSINTCSPIDLMDNVLGPCEN